jgi:hypothetical protein
MERRIFTLALSAIILWASLAAYEHKTYSSKVQEFKVSSEGIAAALAPKFRECEQGNTDHLLATFASVTVARSYSLYQSIFYTSPSIHKSVKAYIIYRVLRN